MVVGMGQVMNMREKMARAIVAKIAPGMVFDEMPPEAQERACGMADAALSAMEEPTEAMVEAGTRAYDEGDGEYGIYSAMVRRAKEG